MGALSALNSHRNGILALLKMDADNHNANESLKLGRDRIASENQRYADQKEYRKNRDAESARMIEDERDYRRNRDKISDERASRAEEKENKRYQDTLSYQKRAEERMNRLEEKRDKLENERLELQRQIADMNNSRHKDELGLKKDELDLRTKVAMGEYTGANGAKPGKSSSGLGTSPASNIPDAQLYDIYRNLKMNGFNVGDISAKDEKNRLLMVLNYANEKSGGDPDKMAEIAGRELGFDNDVIAEEFSRNPQIAKIALTRDGELTSDGEALAKLYNQDYQRGGFRGDAVLKKMGLPVPRREVTVKPGALSMNVGKTETNTGRTANPPPAPGNANPPPNAAPSTAPVTTPPVTVRQTTQEANTAAATENQPQNTEPKLRFRAQNPIELAFRGSRNMRLQKPPSNAEDKSYRKERNQEEIDLAIKLLERNNVNPQPLSLIPEEQEYRNSGNRKLYL